MRKYLALSIALGAIVFVSVSYLARAEERPAGAMDPAVAAFKPLSAPVQWPHYR